MRFWDTSALVPLVVVERQTPRVRRWMAEDDDVVVWTLARVELLSALARRRREAGAAPAALVAARRAILEVWERWSEVSALDLVRRQAERIVESHPLRAADALQIGAALVAAGDDPESLTFVTLDANQAEAAGREGLLVLGP
ncbi:MAG TPA: type II toxin-antitoxin system VapC family toxin [Methylomirabilota bacterium]|nr:type II toxin-antitoxin system VapC family toxin [Methylomirabilota bacterium]